MSVFFDIGLLRPDDNQHGNTVKSFLATSKPSNLPFYFKGSPIMEVRNILVPVDFSVCSKNALRVAIALSRQWDAHIHLVNAISIPIAHAEMGSYMMIEPLIHDQEVETKKLFEQLEQEIPPLKEVTYHVKQYVSEVTTAIHTELDSKNIDMIVMGTKGSHDMIERLLGSITAEIISTSETPVLMVPENIADLKLKKIGFAADFNALKINKAMTLVAMIAAAFSATVIVFHVLDRSAKSPVKKFPAIKKLKNMFTGVDIAFEEASFDEVANGIVQFVADHKLDMLVMLPRQHDFFDKLFKKSVTRNVAMKLKVPLLAIHQK